jgi:beta-fructofuranosidase
MFVINQKLMLARKYEKNNGDKITEDLRPKFHMTPYVGWTNDPNGFSFYQGEYHLFYQYNPYDTVWDSMHWGHAVSKDLLHWTYLPAAMAPDEEYDSFGCFSGCAIEASDGKQLIMYTGVRKEDSDGLDIQTQCIAVGDGVDYVKYSQNPVLDERDLPVGMSPNNFRDPKIWQEPDGSYHCVVGGCRADNKGAILLFGSKDGLRWQFESILIENDGQYGTMWECPDFFPLDKKHVLMVSPQDMMPKGLEYHNGGGTLCLIGTYDEENQKFHYEKNQAIDYGIDFYAPQTVLTPDGRRVMIGWMQNWDTCALTRVQHDKWFGQMSLPRELSIKNGRLYQQPIRELEAYRSNQTKYQNVVVNRSLSLNGIEGRTVDLKITVYPSEGGTYQKFSVLFAQNEQYQTVLSYSPAESLLVLDRRASGSRKDCLHLRQCLIPSQNGELKIRLILDKFSVEVFINDGEFAMTSTIMTDMSAKKISFLSEGQAVIDVTKYDLFAEEQKCE